VIVQEGCEPGRPWSALLWSPSLAAISAGLLFMAGLIDGGLVLGFASAGWLPFWIAAVVVLWRSRSRDTQGSGFVMRPLLIGCLCTYGVVWGVSLFS
jgi:hypothetical protein